MGADWEQQAAAANGIQLGRTALNCTELASADLCLVTESVVSGLRIVR
jgi:hypothetical protein